MSDPADVADINIEHHLDSLLANARNLLGIDHKPQPEQAKAAATSEQEDFEIPSSAVETSRRTLQ